MYASDITEAIVASDAGNEVAALVVISAHKVVAVRGDAVDASLFMGRVDRVEFVEMVVVVDGTTQGGIGCSFVYLQ